MRQFNRSRARQPYERFDFFFDVVPAHVVAHTESRIIFEADRFDEIAEKLSSSTGAGEEGPVKTVVSAAGSSNDFHKTPTQKINPWPMNIITLSSSRECLIGDEKDRRLQARF
jgi:hypothetical protein